jgi:dTDP-4-amino-4,6-dideoxygalactose transaminase
MVPFNRATVAPNQLAYVNEVFSSGHLAGDGSFTRRASADLSQRLDGADVLLTTSCTDALEMCALLLDIGPGDEVIVPAYTFVSTANAFALFGARIVFADVRADTFTIDEEQVAHLVNERTKAVVPVHYGGVDASTLALNALAARHGFSVIEDNAHGLFGSLDGRPLGTVSPLSTLSFHETKNVTSGEGGALVINDEALLDRAEILREKGTNRSNFFRGVVDKYTWVDRGSSYLMSDINAAILLAQLEFAPEIQRRRRLTVSRYREALSEWSSANGVVWQSVVERNGSPDHLFSMLLPDVETRSRFIAALKAKQIAAVFHYQPLHLSPAGLRWGEAPLGCPAAENIADRLVRLPLYSDQTAEETDRVIEAVLCFTT